MRLKIYFGIFFTFSIQLLQRRILAYRITDQNSGDNIKECIKPLIKTILAEDSKNIAKFHEQSDVDKIKALHKETMSMMRNGAEEWKIIEHFYALVEEELGGEEAFLDNYIGLYSRRFANNQFNSTILCFTLSNFKFFYQKAKEAIGTKVGNSQTFWPMIKDIILSADLGNKDIREAPAVMFAVGSVLTFGLPDDVLEQTVTIINTIPKDDLRKRIHSQSA